MAILQKKNKENVLRLIDGHDHGHLAHFPDGAVLSQRQSLTRTPVYNLVYLYIKVLTQVTKIDLKYLPVPPIIIKPRLGTETREA